MLATCAVMALSIFWVTDHSIKASVQSSMSLYEDKSQNRFNSLKIKVEESHTKSIKLLNHRFETLENNIRALLKAQKIPYREPQSLEEPIILPPKFYMDNRLVGK